MTDNRIDDKTGTGRRRWRHWQAPPSNSTPPAAAPRPRTTTAARLRPLLAAALVAPSIVALGALTTPAAAHADFGDIVTRAFGYTGGSQNFTVPDGVAFVKITADGGGGGDGGGGTGDGFVGAAGGAAGEITGTLPVKPGELLEFSIGGGGTSGAETFDHSSAHCNEPGGGTAGYGGLGRGQKCAGGGGGATYVTRGGAIVAVAGGGGGGGAGGANDGGDGGAGFGVNGQRGGSGRGGAAAGDDGGAGGVGGQAGDRVGPDSPINGENPQKTCQGVECDYFGAGGGGGGAGYPKSGSGGKAGSSETFSGGGGGAGGDSYTGGPANTAPTTQGLLIFDRIDASPRGAGTNGQVTISYRAPSTQGFTSADPTTSTVGQRVAYSTVIQDNAGITTPTGSVTFSVGSIQLCSVTLKPDTVTFAAGSGSCKATNTPVGTDTVTTTYSGDGTFPSSNTSATPITVTVLGKATRTTLTAPSFAYQGLPVFLLAKVVPVGAAGTVQFFAESTPLSDPVPVVGGVASVVTGKLTTSTHLHTLTAVFTPTNPAAFATSTSPPMLVVVKQLFPF